MKHISYLLPLAAIMLAGCAQNNTMATCPKQTIVKKYYVENPDIKKAVVILAEKVRKLEEQNSQPVIIETPKEERKVVTKTCPKKVPLLPNPGSYAGQYRAINDVNVRACASRESIVIGTIPKGSIVEFSKCTRYGWCVIKGRDGFVARYMFKKVRNAPSSSVHRDQNQQQTIAEEQPVSVTGENEKIKVAERNATSKAISSPRQKDPKQKIKSAQKEEHDKKVYEIIKNFIKE